MSSSDTEGLLYSLVRQLAGCATPRKLPAPAPPAAASARELDLLRMRERARALDAEIDGLRRRLSGTPEQREEQAGWDLTQGLRAAWGQLQEECRLVDDAINQEAIEPSVGASPASGRAG